VSGDSPALFLAVCPAKGLGDFGVGRVSCVETARAVFVAILVWFVIMKGVNAFGQGVSTEALLEGRTGIS
jgi:hypothetical protein